MKASLKVHMRYTRDASQAQHDAWMAGRETSPRKELGIYVELLAEVE
jgi:hypothetical protein